jgi:hypothetical protein
MLDYAPPPAQGFDVKAFHGSAAGELAHALEADGLPLEGSLLAMPHVYRVAVDADSQGATAVQIGLGGVPEVAYGRLSAGQSALAYGVNLATHLTRIDESTWALQMANNHHSHLVGPGWSRVHADMVGPYRETAEREAELLLPLADPAALRVGVQLFPLSGAGSAPMSIGFRFNGLDLPPIQAAAEWRRYWWEIPAAAVEGGVNEVVLTVSGGRIAVSDLLVERID